MLYYLPSKRHREALLELLHKAGLSYAFDTGRPPTARECNRGPDGGEGVVIADVVVPAHKIVYFPEKQTWRQVPGIDELRPWAGFYSEERPTPAELAKPEMLQGHWVPQQRPWTHGGGRRVSPKSKRIPGGWNVNLIQLEWPDDKSTVWACARTTVPVGSKEF